jgi:hypothetical protein
VKSRALAEIRVVVETARAPVPKPDTPPKPRKRRQAVKARKSERRRTRPERAQQNLFAVPSPVLAAWGGGVDSTAMLIEMITRGERVDAVLFADTGAEWPETYLFIPIFRAWLAARGVPSYIVRNVTTRFKRWGYSTLEENCHSNGTLPSIAFRHQRKSCSLKWKVGPQNRWTSQWAPAREAWAAGVKVIKLIGYDCSPADMKRYAHTEGYTEERYEYRYPLREWGWTREDCIERIRKEGLPIPRKSACFFCPAMKPHELHELPAPLLRRIVLMEARALPRLTDIKGLWGDGVKGTKGGKAKPGSMTQYIREQGLLPADEIDRLIALVPAAMTELTPEAKNAAAAASALTQWEGFLTELNNEDIYVEHTPHLYAAQAHQVCLSGAAIARG